MKDMYSLHASQEELEAFYNKVIDAYKRCYQRLGIGKDTYVTFAAGGAFTKFSHEFQTICETGEDSIYLHPGKDIAINGEVLNDENLASLDIKREELEEVKSAEVGNIFNFGSEKSEQMDVYFSAKDGQRLPVYLGSYGIGITRVMGVLVEKFADEKGLVWPDSIAPFKVYLAQLGDTDEVETASKELYDILNDNGVSTLWDERDERPGVKFGDADLYGIPYRVVISQNTVKNQVYEVKNRLSEDIKMMPKDELLKTLAV